MAFSLVQTIVTTSGSGGTLTATISASGLNNLVVAHVAVATGDVCTGVSDDKGNTYVLSSAVTIIGSRLLYQAYGVQLVSGATIITATFGAAIVGKILGVDEYSNTNPFVSNAAAFDTQTTGTGTGTAVAASTLTPFAAGELMVATLCVSTATNFTAGASYTLAAGANPGALRSQYNLSASASETSPDTLGASRNWGIILNAFKIPVLAAGLFLPSPMTGIGTGGPFFRNPLQ